jgi:hypothetical protein
MVARLLPATRLAIDVGRDEAVGDRRAEQQMVDAEPGVAGERVSKVVPERVDPLVRMQRAQRVGPALLDETAVGVAHFGSEERVIDPALRLVDVEVGRHDVVVAGEHDRRAAVQQAPGVRRQPFEPAELVVEPGSRRRIAVGQRGTVDQ